ncbi:acyl carrier protein [Aureimonas leprariae]|uniref:Acyl carrier protein n=1 Tax=Plantimonas leprariae TaxID=2615207 RepID=A0A7V7PS57_9HYPH|nr:acyl carrier protein [Aureimonas leprariae]KAB0681870.1 acyl carrier protein [Aureimonas leprariae]
MGQNDDLIAGTDRTAGQCTVAGDPVATKIIAVVADVLGVAKDTIGLDTVAADVEGWDSFGHVRIVLAIDKAFGIALSMGAIEKAASVAGLVEVVDEALKAR